MSQKADLGQYMWQANVHGVASGACNEGMCHAGHGLHEFCQHVTENMTTSKHT